MTRRQDGGFPCGRDALLRGRRWNGGPTMGAAVDKLCLKQAENSSFFMVGHPRETGCSQLLPAHVGEYLRPDLWSEHRTSSSFLIT